MKILLLVLVSLSIILISIKIILNYVVPLKEKIKMYFSEEPSKYPSEEFSEESLKHFLFWESICSISLLIIFGIILVVQWQDFYNSLLWQDFYNSLLIKIILIFVFLFLIIFYSHSDLKLFLIYRSYKKKLKQKK